jgi:nucleolar MIF4G domain-containing protein 1
LGYGEGDEGETLDTKQYASDHSETEEESNLTPYTTKLSDDDSGSEDHLTLESSDEESDEEIMNAENEMDSSDGDSENEVNAPSDSEDDLNFGNDQDMSNDLDGEEYLNMLGVTNDEEEFSKSSQASKSDDQNGSSSENEAVIHASAPSAYVPPHLRKQAPSDAYERLKRQLQGLINRLGDPNMDSIVQGIQDALLSNARHHVTEIVTNLVLQTVCDHANLLDSFCATYAGFITGLFHIVGIEFGAHFVQTMIERFQSARKNRLIEKEASSKQCTNLATLLAYLYTFQAVSCVLVFDLVKQSIETIDEIDVEILLRMVKG